MLLGAALFQASSILDGVDGELARVRFQESRLGQWLDTVSDDLSTLLFYAGITRAAALDPSGGALVICGCVAMGALALTSLQYYVELARLGSGDLYTLDWRFVEGRAARGARARLFGLLRVLLKRDFFTLLYLALAVAGLLPLALVIGAAGHTVTLAAATGRTLVNAARTSRG
jgi:phosphatidylglycerophosphate synthase